MTRRLGPAYRSRQTERSDAEALPECGGGARRAAPRRRSEFNEGGGPLEEVPAVDLRDTNGRRVRVLGAEEAGCGESASGACASENDAGRLTPGERWTTDDDG